MDQIKVLDHACLCGKVTDEFKEDKEVLEKKINICGCGEVTKFYIKGGVAVREKTTADERADFFNRNPNLTAKVLHRTTFKRVKSEINKSKMSQNLKDSAMEPKVSELKETKVNKRESVLKPSEIQVLKTRQYDLFQIIKGNREIDQARVKKLASEMLTNDLHAHRPIIVNEDYGIIEGQHTFSARVAMGAEVYFTICRAQSVKSIASFNSNVKAWKYPNYLEAYRKSGVEAYILFDQWVKGRGLSVGHGLSFLEGGGEGTTTTKFKDGDYVFSKDEFIEMAVDVYFAIAKELGMKSGSTYVARAAKSMVRVNGYEHRRMMENIARGSKKITIEKDVTNTSKMLEAVYNFSTPYGGPSYLRFF